MRANRINSARDWMPSFKKQVFHHLYRPRADGTLARATLFYPQIDDPDLAKNATTIYAVELVVVGASGGERVRLHFDLRDEWGASLR